MPQPSGLDLSISFNATFRMIVSDVWRSRTSLAHPMLPLVTLFAGMTLGLVFVVNAYRF
jgi:hypothetical protein